MKQSLSLLRQQSKTHLFEKVYFLRKYLRLGSKGFPAEPEVKILDHRISIY